MQILNYYIPEELRENVFVRSLYRQFCATGKLSPKQINALKNMLNLDLDFCLLDVAEQFEAPEELKDDLADLIAKYKRDRFRTSKKKNQCILAMESILFGDPKQYLIDEALNKDFTPVYKRRW